MEASSPLEIAPLLRMLPPRRSHLSKEPTSLASSLNSPSETSFRVNSKPTVLMLRKLKRHCRRSSLNLSTTLTKVLWHTLAPIKPSPTYRSSTETYETPLLWRAQTDRCCSYARSRLRVLLRTSFGGARISAPCSPSEIVPLSQTTG